MLYFDPKPEIIGNVDEYIYTLSNLLGLYIKIFSSDLITINQIPQTYQCFGIFRRNLGFFVPDRYLFARFQTLLLLDPTYSIYTMIWVSIDFWMVVVSLPLFAKVERYPPYSSHYILHLTISVVFCWWIFTLWTCACVSDVFFGDVSWLVISDAFDTHRTCTGIDVVFIDIWGSVIVDYYYIFF